MKDGVCVRRRPEASLKSLICRCVPSLPKRPPDHEVAAPAAGGPPTRPQVRENCSQRLSRDASIYAKLPSFRARDYRTYASLLPSLIAAVLYLGTAAYQGACVSERTAPGKPLLLLFGLLALVAHAFSLYQQLLTPAGLVLDFFNAASLIAAAVILLTLLATLRIPVENLLLLLFPLGALTTLLAVLIPTAPSSRSTNSRASWPTSCFDPGLRPAHHRGGSRRSCCSSRTTASAQASVRLIRNFPPLQTMESLLFGFLWGGWSLLSLSLLSGWLFVDNLFAQHLAHKTILSCFAWVVFAVLLWGRHQLGWRGHKAIRWTPGRFLPVDVGVLRQQAGAGIHPAHLMGLLHG